MENRNDIELGLKDFFKHKYSLRYFVKQLRWELRYAWRRAWLGYDDVDMIECYEMFRRRMIKILEDFTHNGHAYLNIPNESQNYKELLKKFPEGYFDEEHTEIIYETMIYHLRMMDEDYIEKQLYGSCVCDKNYEIGCRTIKDRKRIANVMMQNKNAFMKLFSLFYYDLWD